MQRGDKEYNGELGPLAIKRLSKERLQLERDNLHDQGILHHFCSDSLHKAVAVIIGPGETPYEHGFYLFDFTFPNSYPLKPPHVVFKTSDGRARLNPNLYADGKVCLSILGTWQGPSWTSSCTFRTTLLSLQSLLHSHPLRNEPGHETESGKTDELYNTIVRYENINVAALVLTNLPEIFSPLRSAMAQRFLSSFDAYQAVLKDFASREGSSDKCPLYRFSTKYEPAALSKRLEALRDKLINSGEGQAEGASTESTASAASTSDDTKRPAEEVASEEPDAKRQCIAKSSSTEPVATST